MDLRDFSLKTREQIDFFQRDIISLRTGRATPALVEHVMVEAYGSKSPLVQLASISAQDAKTIVIQPWDKSILKDIERGIQMSDVRIQPVVDGQLIRLSIPPLTEENRRDLVKILHQKAEAVRVAIRQQREKARSSITTAEEAGEIAEDVKFKLHKELDELVKSCSAEVQAISDKKEAEILSI